ncbi:MAG: hypothetical protein ACOYPS_13125 [Phycisphaerales bacterium]
MDHNVLLTAIAKAAAKAVSSSTLNESLPHGERVKLDTTVELRFVGEVARDRESAGALVDQSLDGYAVLFALVEADLIPGVHTRVVKDVIDAALAIKGDKDRKEDFAAFKAKVHKYLPQQLQERAAAVRVSGNIIDIKEVVR